MLAGTVLNSSCVRSAGGNASGCVTHSGEVLCLQSGWDRVPGGVARWTTVTPSGEAPISRDRHSTTALAPAPGGSGSGGVFLDIGGFHSGSTVPALRNYSAGVHELDVDTGRRGGFASRWKVDWLPPGP